MAGELEFSASLHRKYYQEMPVAQQVYLLLEAKPAAAAAGMANRPVNFCLVLDHSGSMAGTKLRNMKEAARQVVDRLGPGDLISVVVFDDESPAELIVPSQAVTDREGIKHRIDTIQERGGTHMSTGMKLGLVELEKGKSAERVSCMLLVTDGQTWEDREECLELAAKMQSSGFPIYAMGLGTGEESNWDPQLLEDIARQSGGEWFVIDNPEAVSGVFQKTLVSVQGTAVSNAQLTMRLAEGVTPRFVWRVLPLISRLDHRSIAEHDIQVFLGDMVENVGQTLLVDLLAPAISGGVHRLAHADITYDVPAIGLSAQKVSIDILLETTIDMTQAQLTDGRVMNIVERVVAHKLQTQALDEVAAGETAKATQRLRAAATRLLELGEVDLAEQANVQANKIEKEGQIDIATAQKMRYATKRLTELDD